MISLCVANSFLCVTAKPCVVSICYSPRSELTLVWLKYHSPNFISQLSHVIQPLATLNLCSLSIEVPILDILCNICGLWWQYFFFTYPNVFKLHFYCSIYQYFVFFYDHAPPFFKSVRQLIDITGNSLCWVSQLLIFSKYLGFCYKFPLIDILGGIRSFLFIPFAHPFGNVGWEGTI